jgi:hypothetical protein
MSHEDMLQLFDFERFLFDHVIPRDRKGIALATDIVGDAIPDALRPGRSIFQGFRPTGLVEVAPSVKSSARDAELLQRPAHWQMRLLDQPDDLQLFGSGIPHSSASLRNRLPRLLRPSAIMLF